MSGKKIKIRWKLIYRPCIESGGKFAMRMHIQHNHYYYSVAKIEKENQHYAFHLNVKIKVITCICMEVNETNALHVLCIINR